MMRPVRSEGLNCGAKETRKEVARLAMWLGLTLMGRAVEEMVWVGFVNRPSQTPQREQAEAPSDRIKSVTSGRSRRTTPDDRARELG